MADSPLDLLLAEIRGCTLCQDFLPLGPRPVLAARESCRILIIGQAPGIRVHQSGIAWNDPSGNRLREWMNIDSRTFYDESQIAIVPMGFCYPGTGKTGDLPPRPECAPLWHPRLMEQLPQIELTLLLGQYAQKNVLADRLGKNMTETVRHWEAFAPSHLPMPHPSPRNNRWLKKNPWFQRDVLPWLRDRVQAILN